MVEFIVGYLTAHLVSHIYDMCVKHYLKAKAKKIAKKEKEEADKQKSLK